MIKLTLAEIVDAVGGRCRGELPRLSVSGVSIDSRTLSAGELFFAIPGRRFDGHDFVGEALGRGAVAAVVEAGRAALAARSIDQGAQAGGRAGDPCADGRTSAGGAGAASAADRLIEVDDVVAALGRLGAYHRRQISTDVIAVVGSNGKTTTKAMIDHVLSLRLKGRCSPKSFNNAIGVPLTLLSAASSDEYLVVEMGTNAPGEIAALAAMAEPNMAVITCLGEEHLEGLGDLAGVAAEEMSILRHLRPGGFAAVNVDSPEAREACAEPAAGGPTRVTFGLHAGADVHVSDVRYEPPWMRFRLNGRFDYRLAAPGAHNAVNAAGAAVVARRLGFEHEEIAARLETFALPPMRNEVIELDGVTVLNDAYNANPHSVGAALDALQTLPAPRASSVGPGDGDRDRPGRRIVVFGEMRELGAQSAELHRAVAERMARYDLDLVLLVGAAGELMADPLRRAGMRGDAIVRCGGTDECVQALCAALRPGDVVLLKASRAVGLERVLGPLREAVRRFAPTVEAHRREHAEPHLWQPCTAAPDRA